MKMSETMLEIKSTVHKCKRGSFLRGGNRRGNIYRKDKEKKGTKIENKILRSNAFAYSIIKNRYIQARLIDIEWSGYVCMSICIYIVFLKN
jgi:hypothetical protein